MSEHPLLTQSLSLCFNLHNTNHAGVHLNPFFWNNLSLSLCFNLYTTQVNPSVDTNLPMLSSAQHKTQTWAPLCWHNLPLGSVCTTQTMHMKVWTPSVDMISQLSPKQPKTKVHTWNHIWLFLNHIPWYSIHKGVQRKGCGVVRR